jgi:hypothetical protein
MNSQSLVVPVCQSDSRGITSHDEANAPRDSPQEIAKLQIRDDRIIQVQQELQTLVVAAKTRLGPTGPFNLTDASRRDP